MNAKLKSFKFSEITKHRGVKCGGTIDLRLVAINLRMDDKTKKNFIFEMSFHSRALDISKFAVNDHLTFEYDEGNILVKKDDVSGRKLSQHSRERSGHRPRVRFSVPKEYYGLFMEKTASEIEIVEGAIAFKLA